MSNAPSSNGRTSFPSPARKQFQTGAGFLCTAPHSEDTLRSACIFIRMMERAQKFPSACVYIKQLHLGLQAVQNDALIIPRQVGFFRISVRDVRKIPSVNGRNAFFIIPSQFISSFSVMAFLISKIMYFQNLRSPRFTFESARGTRHHGQSCLTQITGFL